MEPTTPMTAPALTDSPILRDADVEDALLVFNQLLKERDAGIQKLDYQRIALHTGLPSKTVMYLLWILQAWGWTSYDPGTAQVTITRVTEAQVVSKEDARRIAAEFDLANAHRIRRRVLRQREAEAATVQDAAPEVSAPVMRRLRRKSTKRLIRESIHKFGKTW